MEGAEDEIQADVAYGIFEIFLNKELRERGSPLYELVESAVDFSDAFVEIFQKFSDEYPLLADTLKKRMGEPAALYRMLQEGEGVTPSRTVMTYYIIQDAPGVIEGGMEDENAGKWLIFIEPEKVDEAWRVVRDMTTKGTLGIASKVSTAKPNPESRDSRKVIFVYTRDWSDREDVMRVREELRKLGFTDRLGYKRNIETFRGEYSKKGKRVTYYSA
ncbi:MAG: DUF1917 domain-containing protein [Methanomicrobiales archaeon]|nr:DUF1917 domain-containing protein [Methanomicrobiales archaeon]